MSKANDKLNKAEKVGSKIRIKSLIGKTLVVITLAATVGACGEEVVIATSGSSSAQLASSSSTSQSGSASSSTSSSAASNTTITNPSNQSRSVHTGGS